MIKTTIDSLPNGLKVVHLHVPGSLAGHFGIAVGAGSSDEGPEEAGLAHFVEHTLFKGTARRSSWHIINRMESVGGELNAFTTKEDTVIYASFPKGALVRAVDLITDLILNSRFPESEIDKERDVICDEINSYLDSPADAVYDDFEDMLYAGTPLGHNILGTVESVHNIGSEQCRGWLDRFYVSSNMVAFYAGATGYESFLRKVTPFLSCFGDRPIRRAEKKDSRPLEVFSKVKKFDLHQAHTVVGCALPPPDVKTRLVYALVTNILGGPGMNSLLNVSLRERQGLVYNVESTLSNWRDSSMFTTYFGTAAEDNDRCIETVNKEIKKMAEGYITPRRLHAAIKQYRGQLMLSRENIENRIMGVARALCLKRQVLSMSETDSLLSQIVCAEVADAASSLRTLSRLTLL